MASGVFVDPSTDQRMMSIGMDRMGMGMVDLGMVQDGTVCGDEKVKSFLLKQPGNFCSMNCYVEHGQLLQKVQEKTYKNHDQNRSNIVTREYLAKFICFINFPNSDLHECHLCQFEAIPKLFTMSRQCGQHRVFRQRGELHVLRCA